MQPTADMHGGSSHMSLGQLGHAGSIALIISRSNLLFLDSAKKNPTAVQSYQTPIGYLPAALGAAALLNIAIGVAPYPLHPTQMDEVA